MLPPESICQAPIILLPYVVGEIMNAPVGIIDVLGIEKSIRLHEPFNAVDRVRVRRFLPVGTINTAVEIVVAVDFTGRKHVPRTVAEILLRARRSFSRRNIVHHNHHMRYIHIDYRNNHYL